MPTTPDTIELSEHELRAITGYAAECARRALPIFERDLPTDTRPRDAIEAAHTFATGGRRTAALRRSAWAALKAAQEATSPAAADAARAASHAAAAAYLHPLASAHQVKHLLGAAAHAARAQELASGEDPRADTGTLTWAHHHAPPAVTAVLTRLPPAPPQAHAQESSSATSTPHYAPENQTPKTHGKHPPTKPADRQYPTRQPPGRRQPSRRQPGRPPRDGEHTTPPPPKTHPRAGAF